MPRRFILIPFGSSGDVHPFLWIARCLGERRHSVILIVAPPFEAPARRLGLDYRVVGEHGAYERAIANPDLGHPWRSGKVVMRFAAEAIRPHFEAVGQIAADQSAESILVASTLAFGARLAREKLGLPLATVHLQPSVFFSAHDSPVPFARWEWFPRLPVWLKRFALRLPNFIDHLVGREVRAACSREGVSAPRSVLREWFHSPDLVLGLFPEWFAAPQPDWPAQHVLCGFPLYDLGDQHALPPGLSAFLDGGPAPILITPGSAMAHAHDLFTSAVRACQLIGRRAILATAHRDQLPADLPPSVHQVDYAPFSRVLPRVAAFVHPGGIGTLAQGLAAGTPQLIVPMVNDQPDNANRLVRLGAGRRLYPRQLSPGRVAAELRTLFDDPSIARTCALARDRAARDRPAAAVISALENLASRVHR